MIAQFQNKHNFLKVRYIFHLFLFQKIIFPIVKTLPVKIILLCFTTNKTLLWKSH